MKDIVVMSDRMVRRIAWFVVVAVGVSACALGVGSHLEARDMAWAHNAEQRIKEAALVAQLYHEDNRVYPRSIEVACAHSDASSESARRLMQMVGLPGGVLGYRSWSNGFELRIVRKGGLLRDGLTFEKTFINELEHANHLEPMNAGPNR
ncbi:MAG: hypothetical protein ACKOET_13525 [Verrucomicrobiota bacterium]